MFPAPLAFFCIIVRQNLTICKKRIIFSLTNIEQTGKKSILPVSQFPVYRGIVFEQLKTMAKHLIFVPNAKESRSIKICKETRDDNEKDNYGYDWF